jgi:hypothetical protein
VARPQDRKFLGFSFTAVPEVKRVIAPKALDRFKQRVREITRRAKSVSLQTTMEELAPYMRGWRSYFGFCETPEVLISLTRWAGCGSGQPCGGSGKHGVVVGQLCWNSGYVRGWQATPPVAGSAPGISLGPRLCLWGYPMHTSHRSDFPHCSRNRRRNRLEPPYTDPYVRWCGRGRRATAAPMPIKRRLWKLPPFHSRYRREPLQTDLAE